MDKENGKDRPQTLHNDDKVDILIVGTSIIKDINPDRMYRDETVKKHILEQKTIAGAKRYISNLTGRFGTILLQVGSNELEHNSTETVQTGISEIVETLNTKVPQTRILVLGILPRWKRSAQEGMNYKRKKNELNSELKDSLSCSESSG